MSNSEIARNMFLFGPKTRTNEATVPTGAHLVDRACAGDKEAFDDIYRMFAPLVHGVVLARVPTDDVQDIVQDVFLVAYNKLDTLRERDAIGAWLARIARNRAAEFYRRSRTTEELSG